MTDWIYNHISSRVPGSHEHYLINPFGLLYEEVSASNLVKVDIHGKLAEEVALDVNPAAFVIHGAIPQARPDVGCVLHTRSAAGVAVATQHMACCRSRSTPSRSTTALRTTTSRVLRWTPTSSRAWWRTSARRTW